MAEANIQACMEVFTLVVLSQFGRRHEDTMGWLSKLFGGCGTRPAHEKIGKIRFEYTIENGVASFVKVAIANKGLKSVS